MFVSINDSTYLSSSETEREETHLFVLSIRTLFVRSGKMHFIKVKCKLCIDTVLKIPLRR